MGDVRVIDGDGHLMEPPDMWSLPPFPSIASFP